MTGKEPSEKMISSGGSGTSEKAALYGHHSGKMGEKTLSGTGRQAYAGPKSHQSIPGQMPGPRMGALTNSVRSLRGGIQAGERL